MLRGTVGGSTVLRSLVISSLGTFIAGISSRTFSGTVIASISSHTYLTQNYLTQNSIDTQNVGVCSTWSSNHTGSNDSDCNDKDPRGVRGAITPGNDGIPCSSKRKCTHVDPVDYPPTREQSLAPAP
eukprot:7954408-Alexandrium_andersonii.AAC.1